MKEKSYKFDLFQSKDVRDRVRCLNSYSVLSGITIDVPVTIEGTQNWAESLSGRHGRKDFVLRDEQGQAVAFSGLVNISHINGIAEHYEFVNDSKQCRDAGNLFLDCTYMNAADELNIRNI